MAKVDLSKLDLAQLREVIAQAEDLIVAKEKEAEEKFKAEVAELAAERGVVLSNLFKPVRGGRGGAGQKVAAKYRDPKDPSLTWSGRGKAPKWMQVQLDAGKSREYFLIAS